MDEGWKVWRRICFCLWLNELAINIQLEFWYRRKMVFRFLFFKDMDLLWKKYDRTRNNQKCTISLCKNIVVYRRGLCCVYLFDWNMDGGVGWGGRDSFKLQLYKVTACNLLSLRHKQVIHISLLYGWIMWFTIRVCCKMKFKAA